MSSQPRTRTTPATPSDANEMALIARLRAGDELAYESLVRSHAPRLLAVARRYLRDPDEAQDALQEALVSAFRSIDRFEGGCRLATWLHRIVLNAALMRLRRRRRRQEQPIEDLLPTFLEDGHVARPARDWREQALSAVERQEQARLVRGCIERLPETFREVLLMRDIEELDTAEVAGLLGCTPNAVKIRLHRARQALRTLLDPHFRAEPRGTKSSVREQDPAPARRSPRRDAVAGPA